MKKQTFLIILVFLSSKIFSQIQVQATAGSSGTTYTTLGAAFTAINNGIHRGDITVNVTGNTTESVTATLNNSGTGSASYTSVLIQPSGGAARTISGSVTGALIDFNGADNVTIDGVNSGGSSLVIENTSTSTSAYTVQVRNESTSITLKKITIKGAGTANVYVFTGGTNGNDNFWVDECDITACSSSATPVHGLYLNAANTDNSKITNCRIYDFYSSSADMYGIRLRVLGSGCDVTGNSFYQTTSKSLPLSRDMFLIGATDNDATIENLNISNNYFGGQTSNAGSSGSPLTLTGAGALKGISLVVGTSNTASIQNNILKNISLSTTGNNILMSLATGSFNCGNITGNAIGDNITSSSGAITGISTGTGTPVAYNISNNTITGITAGASITGIGINETASKVATSYTISNNSVYNLTISSSASSLKGIYLNSSAPNQSIFKNTFYNFTNAGSGDILGIDYNSGGTNTLIQQNCIYNFNSTNTTYGMDIIGINVAPASNKSAIFANNFIVLGVNLSKQVKIYGIYEGSAVGANYYNNSIYIGGTVSAISGTTTYNSAAFISLNGSSTTANTSIIKNNIFYNARSNSTGSAKNYSISLASNSNLTIDNNLYYGTGTGYKMGRYGSTDYDNLCTYKTAIAASRETNSLFKDPKFIDPAGSTPNLHIQSTSPVESMGTAISGITTDFDGNTRNSTPDIGADEGSFTADPVVTLASLGGPYCTSNAAITLSGGNPTGGTFSGTGVSSSAFTPSVSGAGTFTVSYYYTNSTTICNTATQNITVNAQPATPSVSNVTYCAGDVATALTATGSSLLWYAVSSGGTGNSSAPIPTTSSASTTNHYATQTVNGCESPRATITVTVNSLPSAPTASATQSFCASDNAKISNLTVTGSSVKWYDAAVNGNLLTSTTVLTNGTTYYATQTVTGCESTRTGVTATIKAIPTINAGVDATICANETYTLAGSIGGGASTGTWTTSGSGTFSDATSPTAIYIPSVSDKSTGSITLTFTTTDAGSCTNINDAMVLTINALPNAPTAGATQSFCASDNAKISNLAVTGSSVKWYDAPVNGNLLASTTVLTNGNTYYASQTSTCESADRIPVTVTINDVITPSVSISATTTTICSGSTITFSPTPTNGGTSPTYQWKKNGSNAATGSSYAPSDLVNNDVITAVMTSDLTCVAASNATSNGITITVNDPSVGGDISGVTSVCAGTNSSTLYLSGHRGDILKWQSSTAHDFSLAVTDIANTTATYTASNLNTTTYYRAVVKNGICTSDNSNSANITVNNAPSAPTASVFNPTCNTTTGSITINTPLIGMVYSFDNGSSYDILTSKLGLAANSTHHIKVKNNATGCESEATSISIGAALTLPAANATTLTVCATGGSAVSNFTLEDAENARASTNTGLKDVDNGSSSVTVTYHATQADADNYDVSSNTPAKLTSPYNASNGSIIARVRDNTTGCFTTKTVALVTTCVALPVELVDFQVFLVNNAVKLIWTTASEKNSSYFEIERSVDGKTFMTIGQIAANENSQTLSNYEFIDTKPLKGINYYRLKKVDKDLTFDYSKLISANIIKDKTAVKPYPNPAAHTISIEPFEGFKAIKIYNLQGVLVAKSDTVSVDIVQLSFGIYILEVENTEGGKTIRRVVKN